MSKDSLLTKTTKQKLEVLPRMTREEIISGCICIASAKPLRKAQDARTANILWNKKQGENSG